MDSCFDAFAAALKTADAFLWGPPLLILLLGTHLFYTIRLRFIQRHIGSSVKLITRKDDQVNGNVAPFAALAVALASTIGTGNVVGVATAIVMGGPGAVFWCAVTGVFGMATKYAESLLAVKFRVRDEKGEVHGGPSEERHIAVVEEHTLATRRSKHTLATAETKPRLGILLTNTAHQLLGVKISRRLASDNIVSHLTSRLGRGARPWFGATPPRLATSQSRQSCPKGAHRAPSSR